jgi:PAS domain S-box-containing protein
MYDEQRYMVRWSKQHEDALGYSAQELAHHHVLDFFEGEDKALIKSRVDQIFATGEADAEARIGTKNGERIPYYFTGRLTTLGGKRYFVGLGVDISERVRAEEALRRYAERLQILYEIDQGILAAQSPETIAQAAVAHLRQLIPCRRAGVTLYDFAAQEALLLAVDLDAESQVEPGARISLEPFEDVIAAGRQGSATVVTGLASRGKIAETLYVEGMHSLVSVPLLSQGELIGSINLSFGASDPGAFTREWEDVARQVADQLAIAIQQARLYEQVQRHAEELEQRLAARTRELAAFFDLATLTARGWDLSEILEPALTRIMDVAHCQAICVHLLDEGGSALQLVSQRNLPDEARQRLGIMTVGDDFLRRISQVGDPITATDLARSSLLPDPLRLEGFQSYLGVSLRAGGYPLGWLSYYRASDGGFALDETALLAALAEQIGVIVENHNLRLRMEEAAVLEERGRLARELHDSVTQLLYSIGLFAKAGRDAYKQGNVEQGSGHLSKLGDIAGQAIKEMRLLLYELRPRELEREGLIAAIQHRLDAVEGRAGVKTQLVVDTTVELSREVERELYHILQEALNNALKHAKATSVQVRIQADREGIRLDVTDDGSGFAPHDIPDEGGMGLANMHERAKKLGGILTVLSGPGKGTSVQFNLENPGD